MASTIIHELAKNGKTRLPELKDYLISNPTDVNSIDKYNRSALRLACRYLNDTSSLETVKLLIEYGANITLQNNKQENIIQICKQERYHNIINILEEYTIINWNQKIINEELY